MALLYKPTGTYEPLRRTRTVFMGDSECTFGEYSSAQMTAWVRKLVTPTINLITVGEPQNVYFPDIARYFGGYVTGLSKSDELPPPPVTHKVPTIVEKGPLKRKDFEKAKKERKIILQPFFKRSCEVTLHPGVSSPISSGTPYLPHLSVRDSSRWVSNPCLVYKSTPLDSKQQIAEFGEPSLVVNPRLERCAAFNLRWSYPNVDPQFITEALDIHFRNLAPSPGLVTSAIAEANDGEFDLLTNLGEFPETVGWILGTIKDIITLWRKTRKDISRIKSHSAKALEIITQRWLEFRYAIMPLVFSVNDALDLLKAEYVEFQTIRKGMTHDPIDLGHGIIFPRVTERCYLKQSLFAEIDRVNAGAKINIFSTAWELVPLSFVIDWVFNIGDVLSSIGTPSHVNQRVAQSSWRVNDTVSVPGKYPGAHAIVYYNAYRAVNINPQSYIGFSFNPSMTWKRWADALSLSWQIFRKKS